MNKVVTCQKENVDPHQPIKQNVRSICYSLLHWFFLSLACFAQVPVSLCAQSLVCVGNRIPKDFFITTGKGQSDITVHAGSLHLAMVDAGVAFYNIMPYTSILPAIATEVDRPLAYVHGSVLEVIWAVATAERGEQATAGIIYGWLYDRQTGSKFGGLVCEYNGALSEEEAGAQLYESLQELYSNGFEERYELKEIRLITDSLVPEKKYGSVIIVLGFCSHVVPVLS